VGDFQKMNRILMIDCTGQFLQKWKQISLYQNFDDGVEALLLHLFRYFNEFEATHGAIILSLNISNWKSDILPGYYSDNDRISLSMFYFMKDIVKKLKEANLNVIFQEDCEAMDIIQTLRAHYDDEVFGIVSQNPWLRSRIDKGCWYNFGRGQFEYIDKAWSDIQFTNEQFRGAIGLARKWIDKLEPICNWSQALELMRHHPSFMEAFVYASQRPKAYGVYRNILQFEFVSELDFLLSEINSVKLQYTPDLGRLEL
jgi:hypothetical protein